MRIPNMKHQYKFHVSGLSKCPSLSNVWKNKTVHRSSGIKPVPLPHPILFFCVTSFQQRTAVVPVSKNCDQSQSHVIGGGGGGPAAWR
jgi:hypothetical protein